MGKEEGKCSPEEQYFWNGLEEGRKEGGKAGNVATLSD